jgi:hypothetical protein
MADPYALSGPLPGALQLPDGTWIRARSLRNQPPIGPDPHFGIYLGIDYQPVWEHIVVAWPDFWLPRDPAQTARQLGRAYGLARSGHRVEIACAGGVGRTGTALAALAILAGTQPDEAVPWVREVYHRHAVETPWQRRWVRRFPRLLDPE